MVCGFSPTFQETADAWGEVAWQQSPTPAGGAVPAASTPSAKPAGASSNLGDLPESGDLERLDAEELCELLLPRLSSDADLPSDRLASVVGRIGEITQSKPPFTIAQRRVFIRDFVSKTLGMSVPPPAAPSVETLHELREVPPPPTSPPHKTTLPTDGAAAALSESDLLLAQRIGLLKDASGKLLIPPEQVLEARRPSPPPHAPAPLPAPRAAASPPYPAP